MANSQIPLAGPLEATAAYLNAGKLYVVDGRGQVWGWDSSVTTDANGDTIVAPATIDQVQLSPPPNRSRLLILSGTTMWAYNMNTGFWTQGLDITQVLPDDAGNTLLAWKRGHNWNTPAGQDDPGPVAAKAKAKAKEHA